MSANDKVKVHRPKTRHELEQILQSCDPRDVVVIPRSWSILENGVLDPEGADSAPSHRLSPYGKADSSASGLTSSAAAGSAPFGSDKKA